MEPDSSTDNQEDAQNSSRDQHSGDVNDSDTNDDNRMQRLLKEHARLFCNVKNDPDGSSSSQGAKWPLTHKTAQEELADLMKLTNQKLFRSPGSSDQSLPLSVDLEEQDPGSRPPLLVSSHLSQRKRGRKPKHYSEILYSSIILFRLVF